MDGESFEEGGEFYELVQSLDLEDCSIAALVLNERMSELGSEESVPLSFD